jgi:hypothetical protein
VLTFTLVAAGVAAGAAVIAAFAAVRAERIAADTEHNQLRAYVAVKSVDLDQSSCTKAFLKPNFENSGDTPTRHLIAYVGLLPKDESVSLSKLEPFQLFLAPHTLTSSADAPVTREQFANGGYILYAWAIYDDVFGGLRHRTRQAWRVQKADKEVLIDDCNWRVTYPSVEDQVCMDDECPLDPN